MNIKPKIQIFSGGGVSGVDRTTDNWYNNIFVSGGNNSLFNHTLLMLALYGDDYMNWVNGMLSDHAKIYNQSGGAKGNWKAISPYSEATKLYLKNFSKNPYTNYNLLGINNAFKNNIFKTSGIRTSGDNPNKGYVTDGNYSSITDFRRVLGRKGDWTPEQLTVYKLKLNELGYDIDLDSNDYYKIIHKDENLDDILRKPTPSPNLPSINLHPGVPDGPQAPNLNFSSRLQAIVKEIGLNPKNKATFWDNLLNYIHKNGANFLEYGRLAGALINNNRIYNATKEGIIPNLLLSYHTYRNIVGDEATRNAYYTRAVEGENLAARPITSDADKNVAYRQEARRVGNLLRAQGDLADNLEIKRTTDESNEHSWRNILRDTDVANANRLDLNRVAAALANLKAQKISADWTSIDNHLLAKVYELKLNQLRAKYYLDLIFTLNEQEILLNDPTLRKLRDELYTIYKNNGENTSSIDYVNKMREVNAQILKLRKESLERYKDYELNNIYTAKSGTKLTLKLDLLYKTIRDSVDHFRKMSKMSDDSRTKNKGNKVKLISHPSKKTKRMLLGGVAPFLIYKPAALGGETSTLAQTTTTKSSESKDNKKDNSLDFVKDLFGKIMSNEGGLPIDVLMVSTKIKKLMDLSQMFGTELSTSDIQGMYLSSMIELVNAKHGKELWKQALQQAYNNDALNEYAINELGQVAVLIKDTNKLQYMDWNTIKLNRDKVTPLTNQNLLNLRAYSPALAFDYSVLETVGNGIGVTKIADFLKSQLPNIGSTEETIEGYTKQDSINIKEGIKLLQDAPIGDYKYTQYNKTQLLLYQMALKYLARILPDNMKTILAIHADKQGITPTNLIADMIGASVSNNSSLKFDAVTGKASSSKDGNSKGDNLEINYALKLLTGIGEPLLESFGIGNNNSFLAFGRSSIIATTGANEEAFGADFSYNELYKSGVGKILNLDNVSFGDVPINKAMKDSIIVDNSRIVGVDLPYTRDSSGRIIPNFKMLAEIEKADKEAMLLNLNPENPNDINKINLIYVEHELPIKYKGTNLLTDNYIRFAVILATASEDAFLNKEGLSSNKTLTLVSDNQEINKYVRLMKEITKDTKYSLDRPGIFSFGNKDIYKGSIFIPITGDITDATLAGGASKMTTGMSTNLEILRDKWHTRNYVAPPEINTSKK